MFPAFAEETYMALVGCIKNIYLLNAVMYGNLLFFWVNFA